MVQNTLDDRKVDAQASHSRGNATPEIVVDKWRHPRKFAVERELSVRPSIVAALASGAEDQVAAVSPAVAGTGADTQVSASGQDGQCRLAQRYGMGSPILSSRRGEVDDASREVDLRPPQPADLHPSLAGQHQQPNYVAIDARGQCIPDLGKFVITQHSVPRLLRGLACARDWIGFGQSFSNRDGEEGAKRCPGTITRWCPTVAFNVCKASSDILPRDLA
jgi:hypothetical protein